MYGQPMKFTQGMLLKMGRLVKLAETQASWLEKSVLGMIEIVVAAVVAHIHASVNALTLRVASCEKRQGIPLDITALQVMLQVDRQM